MNRGPGLSGKGGPDENFPVGSWLLARRIRPHVHTFYRFARTIDDIADSPVLSSSAKVSELARYARALEDPSEGDATARAMRLSLAETGISVHYCLDLVRAFVQDATKDRYTDWAELMDYCRLSAAPVGRYLIDLHGGPTAAYPAADALCHALQVLNHLQDCGHDYRTLDRVYLPQEWMEEAQAATGDLGGRRTPAALRRVLDRCLTHVRELLTHAAPLPRTLKSLRLAQEAAIILAVARQLTCELKRRDPLAQRVVLQRTQVVRCAAEGVARGLWLRRLRHA